MHQAHLLKRTYRITRIIIHTFTGLIIAAAIFPLLQNNTKLRLTNWWCDGLLRAFGIKVNTFGNLPAANIKGILFVANHVSWADIHALNSKILLRFIAKSDIKNWPIFGYLVTKANTLFIDRSKRQEAGKIVATTAVSLLAGDNLCFFPEGTTTDGTHILPFKSSVLQAAIDANTVIWPVAIRYVNYDGSTNKNMAYAGETSLVESMKAVLNVNNPVVELHFLTPISTKNKNRRELTLQAHNEIKATLSL
jgi:1-acyl-sn-glycerol-3-phosphate acyltransferase